MEGSQSHARLANISKARWQEHLSNKLKERSFIQDELDPCLFVNVELDICIGVHVDDMLAVGPSESTKTLLKEFAKDMARRWRTVTDKHKSSWVVLCAGRHGVTTLVCRANT